MKDKTPEPWHAADEKPSATDKRGGAPIGTHSLTGGGATVGMPPRADDAERSKPLDEAVGEDPDPLAEPRATGGGLLGPKP